MTPQFQRIRDSDQKRCKNQLKRKLWLNLGTPPFLSLSEEALIKELLHFVNVICDDILYE
jgi:hypothetical protein